MADRRFFDNAGPFALSELAAIAEAELAAGVDGARRFADVAPLDAAGPDDVSFLDNRRYVGQFGASKAGACIVSPELAERAPPGMALLLTRRPYRGYAKVAQAFYPTPRRSEEHTSELQSLMRISYAVFCLKKNNTQTK